MRFSCLLHLLAFAAINSVVIGSVAVTPKDDLLGVSTQQAVSNPAPTLLSVEVMPLGRDTLIQGMMQDVRVIMQNLRQQINSALVTESQQNDGSTPASLRELMDHLLTRNETEYLAVDALFNETWTLESLFNNTLINVLRQKEKPNEGVPLRRGPTGIIGLLADLLYGVIRGVVTLLVGLLVGLPITLRGLLGGSLSNTLKGLSFTLNVILDAVFDILEGLIRGVAALLHLRSKGTGRIADLIDYITGESNPFGYILLSLVTKLESYSLFDGRLGELISESLSKDSLVRELISHKLKMVIANILRHKNSFKLIIKVVKHFISNLAHHKDDVASQALRSLLPKIFAGVRQAQGPLITLYVAFMENHPGWKIIANIILQRAYETIKPMIQNYAYISDVFANPSPDNINYFLQSVANMTDSAL